MRDCKKLIKYNINFLFIKNINCNYYFFIKKQVVLESNKTIKYDLRNKNFNIILCQFLFK